MRYVGYDQFRRRPADAGYSRPRASGLLTPSLLFASVALLVLSRLDHGFVAGARLVIVEAVSPVLRTIMIPLEPVRTVGAAARRMFVQAGELERLGNENQRLKVWETRAKELERQLADLGAVAETARDSDIAFVTARVMATSSGPFARSAMINAGTGEQIKAGYPVLASNGLAGRVAVVGQGVSRLLLLTDADSRVPVTVGERGVRAVLAGDNGAAPRLIFVAAGVTVKAGDEVTTSGIGGIFPRGLRIGTVVGSGERPPVALHTDLDRLEYVSVLFYRTDVGGLPPLEDRPHADSALVPP